MKNIFNPTGNAELIARINKLTPESQRLWGEMSVSQMMAHCSEVMKVALGEVKLKRNLMGVLFGGTFKKKLIENPFPKNLRTFKEAKIVGERNFEEEKQRLIDTFKRFAAGPSVLMKGPHPFFGPLTVEEWNILQIRHLEHHLEQFGV